jgi:hypothetical protein
VRMMAATLAAVRAVAHRTMSARYIVYLRVTLDGDYGANYTYAPLPSSGVGQVGGGAILGRMSAVTADEIAGAVSQGQESLHSAHRRIMKFATTASFRLNTTHLIGDAITGTRWEVVGVLTPPTGQGDPVVQVVIVAEWHGETA